MEGCLSLFLAPLGLFVTAPFLAFLPAAVFLVYYIVRRPAAGERGTPGRVRWSLLAGLAWLGYGFYELAMSRWSQGVAGAPIRIDLFVVAPALYVLSALAFGMAALFELPAPAWLGPSIPNPYSRQRDRAFVICIAILLAGFLVLDVFIGNNFAERDLRNNVVRLLLALFFSVYLMRGREWARWLLFLWLFATAFSHFIAWVALHSASRPDLGKIQLWNVTATVLAGALGAVLLVSKRLRDHLAASAPAA